MKSDVCGIVVTYNRKELLQECLRALGTQTHGLAALVVVDNASTDGTRELFEGAAAGKTEWLHYMRLESNLGGAGGFRAGMEAGHKLGHEWLWLMDDDTIPTPTALAELLAAFQRFPENNRPTLLASKVEWTDGTLHSMNFPTVKRASTDPARALLAAKNATLWVRWASFVSALIQRSAVAEHGFPHADYFIWNDDTEYTARILRRGFGVLVPASVVVHKTAAKHSAIDAPPARAFYQVRNVLWMALRSPAWSADERWKIAAVHLLWIIRYLTRRRFRRDALHAVYAGLRDGFLTQPRA